MDRSSDEKVWAYAAEEGFTILSKDADFHHMSLVRGFPPKVIFLKVGNCATDRILMLIRRHGQDLEDFHDDEDASLLIIGP